MTEQAFTSRHIRFAGEKPRRDEDFRGPYVGVVSQRTGLECRLSPEEHDLALLFDGENSASERLNQARQHDPALESTDLERLTHMLCEVGLLWAGSDEPLPPPPQTDAEMDKLGVQGASAGDDGGLPPSTSPGSLAGPGLGGPLAGSTLRPRDESERIDVPLRAGRWLWLGRLFAAPVYSRLAMAALWLFAAALLTALWRDRLAATTDFQRLLDWDNLFFVGLPAALVSNFVAHICRAAVIHKESGELPRFGLNWILGFIPRFMSDTEGPAERLNRAGRARVLSAALTGNLVLFCALLLSWFVIRQSTTMLPAAMITAALFALANTVLRLNPLARSDGYYLLAFQVKVADLREQAVLAVFGVKDRWGNRKPLPARWLVLYALACVIWLVSIVTLILLFPAHWLEAHYGGTAVALILAALVFFAYTLRQRFADNRGEIGNLPLRSRLARGARSQARQWHWFVLFCVLALIPYTYEPGGRFQVLPADRVEISSELSGQLIEVLVEEGQQVEAGELIARLDDTQWRSQLEQARANVANIEAKLARARNGATDEERALARQVVATAQARLRAAQVESRRAIDAHRRKAITSAERDRAVENSKVRAQELHEAEQQLALIESDTRAEDIDALSAQLSSEQAAQAHAQEQLERTRIRSPLSGVVVGEQLRFARGRFLELGEVIAAVEDTRQLQAEMHLPEFAVSHAQMGSQATLKTWMRPAAAYHGQVVSIAPAAEHGENGRIVRVVIDIYDADASLKVNMSGQAKIQAETGPALIAFSRAIIRFVTVELWSWLP